jgi:hypothetical protein
VQPRHAVDAIRWGVSIPGAGYQGGYRHRHRSRKVLALFVFLRYPTAYAMAYDMPIVATAMVLVMQERDEVRGAFNLIEIMILSLAATMPALMSVPDLRIPMATISVTLLFVLIVRRVLMQPSVYANEESRLVVEERPVGLDHVLDRRLVQPFAVFGRR